MRHPQSKRWSNPGWRTRGSSRMLCLCELLPRSTKRGRWRSAWTPHSLSRDAWHCIRDQSGSIGINREWSIGIQSDQSGSHRINQSVSIGINQSGPIGINRDQSIGLESLGVKSIGINRDQSGWIDQSGSISINRDACAPCRFSQFLELFFLLSEIFLNFRNKWKVGVFLFLFIDEFLLCAALRWTRWDENALKRHIRSRTSPQMRHLTRVYQSVTFEFGQVCRCNMRRWKGFFSKDRSRSYRGRISQEMRIFSKISKKKYKKNSKKKSKKIQKKINFFSIFFFFFEKFKKCMHGRWRKINDRGCQIKRHVFKSDQKMVTFRDTHSSSPLGKIDDFTQNVALFFGSYSFS